MPSQGVAFLFFNPLLTASSLSIKLRCKIIFMSACPFWHVSYHVWMVRIWSSAACTSRKSYVINVEIAVEMSWVKLESESNLAKAAAHRREAWVSRQQVCV